MTDTSIRRVSVVSGRGKTTVLSISPLRFVCARLVGTFADAWRDLTPEIPGSAQAVRQSICDFASFLAEGLERPDALRFTPQQLRREHLDRWERDLAARQRLHPSDLPYRLAIHLFAFLRRFDDDHPGVLHPLVADRVRRPTRLTHFRGTPVVAFTTVERRQLIRAAKAMIDVALRDEAGPAAPSRDTLIALFVLLALGTGQPPEVLRRIRVQDITITWSTAVSRRQAPKKPHDSEPECFTIRLTKSRAGRAYDFDYPRRERLVHWTLTAMMRLCPVLTAGGRDQSIWQWSKDGAAALDASWDSSWSLSKWATRHVRDSALPWGRPLSDPVNYMRLRKSTVAREALRDPVGYLRDRRNHSPRTFFERYTASAVLRARAGKILIDATTELFEHAVRGPTVIDPEAEALLTRGCKTRSLAGVDVPALLHGELDGPLVACREPLNSPYAPSGQACPSSANGACYSCLNAVITRRHLPAALAVADALDPDRFGRPQGWVERWQPTYQFLTQVVFKQFSPEEIEQARRSVAEVLLDPGLHQGPGGLDAPS